MVHPCVIHMAVMLARGSPMGLVWVPWVAHESPVIHMAGPWVAHGFATGMSWVSYGFIVLAHGSPMAVRPYVRLPWGLRKKQKWHQLSKGGDFPGASMRQNRRALKLVVAGIAAFL